MTTPTYFVTDIETNGPYPGVHSMLGFASAACRPGDGILDTFEANIEPLPGMTEHEQVMAWWKTQPDAHAYVTNNPSPAADVITRWVDWIEGFDGERIFAAYAIIFDGAWLEWYLRAFADRPLFRGPIKGTRLFDSSGLDLPSFATGVLNLAPKDVKSSTFPREWLGNVPHSHRAIDDATGYANLLLHLLALRQDK